MFISIWCTFEVNCLQGRISQIRVSFTSLHCLLRLVSLVDTPEPQDLEQGDQAVV